MKDTVKATINGTIQISNKNVYYRHPVVEKASKEMVRLVDITRSYGMSDSKHSAWFKSKITQSLVESMCQQGIPRERVSCVVETMNNNPRTGNKMVGGIYVHPLLAERYKMYLAGEKQWYDLSTLNTNPNTLSKALTEHRINTNPINPQNAASGGVFPNTSRYLFSKR